MILHRHVMHGSRMTRARRWGSGSIARRGHRWLIRWVDQHGRRLAQSFPDRATAERALVRKLDTSAAKKGGVEPQLRGKPPTLNALAAPWLEKRRAKRRSAYDDANRWKNHLAPEIGHLTPGEVTEAIIRDLVDRKLRDLSPTTVRLCLRLLSTFYRDLVPEHAAFNPLGKDRISRAVWDDVKPTHDPTMTPFLERAADIRRVFLALPEPVNIAFAIGSLAGLRTGEVIALKWEYVNLETRRIHVRESVRNGKLGPLKDDESRVVPILDSLAPVLNAWRLRSQHALVVPPLRSRRVVRHVGIHTLWDALREALATLKLPAITWYQATRHTFASQWVQSGGELGTLRQIMGHSTVLVTERYAHLRPDLYEGEEKRISVDLSAPELIQMPQNRDHYGINSFHVKPQEVRKT